MKKRFENRERKGGPPCRFRTMRRSKSLGNDDTTDDKKWHLQQRHKAWMDVKTSVCFFHQRFLILLQ